MARISADFDDVLIRTALAKDTYKARIFGVTTNLGEDGKVIIQEGKTQNPMMTLDLIITDGAYKDQHQSTFVMLGGTTKKGDPMPLGMNGGLLQLLQEARVPCTCRMCGANLQTVGFLKGGPETGLAPGKVYCGNRECRQVLKPIFDTTDMIGRDVGIVVDLGKDKNEEDQSSVVRFIAIEKVGQNAAAAA